LIGVPQPPERLAISAVIRTAGCRKFVQRRDVTRIRRIFRNGRIRDETATERYQTESPGAAIPRPLSAFGPIFLQNCTLYWGCRFAGYGNKWPSQ